MWSMIYPIMIIVASNVMYNVCQKSMPSKVNPFAPADFCSSAFNKSKTESTGGKE